MHEIEVKAVVRDLDTLLTKLQELGCTLSDPITEEDILFSKEVSSLDAYNRNADFLRIRVRGNGEVIFTLKHHPDRHEGRPDSMPLEYETTVGSKEACEHILTTLGYQEAVRVSKTRRKGKLDAWEICVDEVRGLGTFIEMEELGKSEDAARIIEDMRVFYETKLGIPREEQFADRYDIALLKKQFGSQ